MSFTAYSTTTPQVGEEQPLSSTSKLVSFWTLLDISAAFPGGKTPYSVKALIILGADLPASGLIGKMRVRKFGDTNSYEEAPGVLGITSIIYRDGGEYRSGGFAAIITIPVDTDGKFEYQLQNDSGAPRTIIRILEVTTVEELPDATATPAPDRIPISDGAGKLDAWVSTPSIPPAFEVIDALTEVVSHTGDTAETTLHTAVVPADKMGAKGIVRISLMCKPHAASNFNVYFGQIQAANRVGYWTHASTDFLVYSHLMHVWNKGATNAQGGDSSSGALILGQHWVAFGSPLAMTEDTTADVPIYFTVQNNAAPDESYLYLAIVEALHKD